MSEIKEMKRDENGKKIPESYIECGSIECRECSFSTGEREELEDCGHLLGEVV